MPIPQMQRSFPEVLQDIIANFEQIVRAEIKLAKTEVQEEATKVIWVRVRLSCASMAVARTVALPRGIVAVTRLGELTVRTDARLRVHAPKQTVIAGRHRLVALRIDEKSLPTKRGAQIMVAGIKPQPLWFRNHAAPPFAR